MSIGAMRHRVSVIQLVLQTNENGFEETVSEVIKTLWAEVSNVHGKEYFAAKAVQAENTVKFKIRFYPELKPSMHIAFDGRVFNITGIDHIKFGKRYMEVLAMEVTPSGKA